MLKKGGKRPITSKRGFTLIELLIVVAIIAILAAIAVPNFLEAQTRSKVSRVKSDLRTLNTAFQAYFVDHLFIPVDGDSGAQSYDYQGWSWNVENPGRPPDIGFRDIPWSGPTWHAYRFFTWITTPVAYITSVPHDAFSAFMPYMYDHVSADTYSMCASCGPDRIACDWLRTGPTGMAIPYDSTNGTQSRGDIWRGMIIKDLNTFKQHYPFEYN